MNILNIEKVSKTYGEKELFNNISMGINSGDKIGLIGSLYSLLAIRT